MSKKADLVVNQYRKRSRSAEIFRSIRKNRGSFVGLIVLCLIFVVFLVSLFIPFTAVTSISAKSILLKPSWKYPFGTDELGRNLFLRVVYGTRYSIVIGLGCTAISCILGTALGAVAGFYGGKLENFIMRCCDVLSSIPGMLSAMVMMTAFGQTLPNMILAMGLTSVPLYVRMTRASVLSVRNNEFVEAARAIGIPNVKIIFQEVLLNGFSPVIITITSGIGMTIIAAAGLSFIGFGVAPPSPEWGGLISSGRQLIRSAPWVTLFPGLAIMLMVLSINLLGDGLRDALDPKFKK